MPRLGIPGIWAVQPPDSGPHSFWLHVFLLVYFFFLVCVGWVGSAWVSTKRRGTQAATDLTSDQCWGVCSAWFVSCTYCIWTQTACKASDLLDLPAQCFHELRSFPILLRMSARSVRLGMSTQAARTIQMPQTLQAFEKRLKL